MKEQWISIEEFSNRTGLTTDTLYSKISRTRNTDKDHSKKYKKDGKTRLINYAYFSKEQQLLMDMQKRFETAYYGLFDKLGCDYAVSKAIALDMGISAHAVNMYFRDCFFVSSGIITKRRLQYIESLERVFKKVMG